MMMQEALKPIEELFEELKNYN